jgi:hypothetical protein
MRDKYQNYSQPDIDNIKLYEWLTDYLEETRIRLVMKDREDFDPDPEKKNLVYYDSFDAENNDTQKNNIRLRICDIQNSDAEAGVFAFTFEDVERHIDLHHIGHNNIVIIQGKKLREDNWQNMMYGICRKDEQVLYGAVGHNIIFSGFGTGIIANETVLDFKRIATRSDIGSTAPFRDDPRMYSSQLTKDVFEAHDVYPEKITSKNKTLKDRGNFDLSGIDMSLTEFIPGMTASLVVASRVLNDIAALVGADWYVDENNIVRHVFLSNKPTGVTFKNIPHYNDNKEKVSYLMSNLTIKRSCYVSDGFANKLWANVAVVDVQKTGGSGRGGSQPLFDIDVAQQLPAGIILKDIALLLQRNGAGTSSPNSITTLHGHIVKDASNTPTGRLVCHFDIPLQQISADRPTAVFIPNLTISPGVTIGTTEKLWIILYDRGNNLTNTILWFKGNDNTSRVAKREPQDNLQSNDGWAVLENQNTLAYAAFNRTIQRVSASDPYSIKQCGLVEKVVSVPLANDPATVDKYLHQMLLVTAKPKLEFDVSLASIPNELLRPRTAAVIEENRISMANNKAMPIFLSSVDYQFDASNSGVGTRFATVVLSGLYDYRYFNLKRQSKTFSCTR